MHIELDLPDWVDERHIRIFAGIELAAMRNAGQTFWKIKETRCNQCGKCCFLKPNNAIYPLVNGHCVHLHKRNDGKYECKIPITRSRICGDDPHRHIRDGECCITYKIVPCE